MDRPFRISARPALAAAVLLIAVASTATAVLAQSPAGQPAARPGAGAQARPGGGGSTGTPAQPGVVAPDPGPDQPVDGGPDQPVDGGPGGPAPVEPATQWQPIVPRNDLRDVRPQAWDHISISPDGKTLTVHFWGGVEPCYGVAGVDVKRTADGVAQVTLLTGTPPSLEAVSCIDIAMAYQVAVPLDDPFVVDPARVSP